MISQLPINRFFNGGKIMQQSSSINPPNKLVLAAVIAAFLAVVGSAYILYYLGAFSTVVVQHYQAPSYRIAYVDNTGPYNKIDAVIESVELDLASKGIEDADAIAIFLDDPSVVATDKLRSKVGFIVSDLDPLPGSLEVMTQQSSEVVKATFHGSPLVGSYKAYSAMKQWCADNGYLPSLPGIEIYRNDGTIEYQLAITKK